MGGGPAEPPVVIDTRQTKRLRRSVALPITTTPLRGLKHQAVLERFAEFAVVARLVHQTGAKDRLALVDF